MPTNFVTPLGNEYGVADAQTAPVAVQGTNAHDRLARAPGVVTAGTKMGYTLAWICAALAALLTAVLLYGFGLAPLSSLVRLLLVSGPVVVVWVSLRLSRQCECDIRDPVERKIQDER